MVAFTPKEGLCQEENITARILARCDVLVIKENERKKLYFPVWGESQQDGNQSRPTTPKKKLL
jgi:hypothetical protein